MALQSGFHNHQHLNNNNNNNNSNNNIQKHSSAFANQLQISSSIPSQFLWPEKDLVPAQHELQEPLVDLHGYFKGEKEATRHAANLVRSSCLHHGFFQVINHGVDPDMIKLAHLCAKAFFVLPVTEKLRGEPLPGSRFGYSIAHSSRYSTRLPWKETITFGFPYDNSDGVVVGFFESKFGKEFEDIGRVFQKYSEAMKKLSLVLVELLGISLGVDGAYFKEFYKDGSAIVRANCYPICPEPGLTLGVGPHNDPTSLTILHQDQVGGLELFVDNKWKSIRPRNDAFVINIGDTFSAITNGIYKSCLHRAIVNKHQDRISLTYFLNPREDKVVKPPEDLISREEPRKYPDFTWFDFMDYTFKHYRADGATFQNFTNWLSSFNPSN